MGCDYHLADLGSALQDGSVLGYGFAGLLSVSLLWSLG